MGAHQNTSSSLQNETGEENHEARSPAEENMCSCLLFIKFLFLVMLVLKSYFFFLV